MAPVDSAFFLAQAKCGGRTAFCILCILLKTRQSLTSVASLNVAGGSIRHTAPNRYSRLVTFRHYIIYPILM
jgi:hypothetical protein